MSARHVALAVAVATVLAVACRREEKRPAPAPAPAPAPRVAMVAAEISYERVVESAAKLAIADALPADAVRAHAAALRENAETGAAKLVDDLLSDKRFASDVAVGLIVREHFAASNVPVSMTLRTAPGPEPIYFLRAACSASAAERVAPWWAPNTTVLVCPDSHRPAVTGDGRYQCGGRMLDPASSPTCGCGPHLVQCARDGEHLREIRASVRNEIADTIAYTVEHDEPVAQIFLRNDTVRDATTEVLDRRFRLMNGETLTLNDVPQGKALRPRTEGFDGHHAGILTTPHMLYRVDAPRAMLRVFYELMWCQAAASANVSTDKVLALKALDLRQGEGWKELAAMPICTNCHARLDYGVQFFSGFPSPIHGLDFVPARHKTGEGPLYAANIDDKIGVASLTPRGFAERAVARDDFTQCMVKNVAEHVFGPGETPEDRSAVLGAFRRKPTLRTMMREALMRFVKRQLVPHVGDAPAPHAPAAAKAEGELISVSSALRAAINDRCVDCHDDDATGPSLTAQSLPRATVASMLNQIAFYGMPKNQPLGDEARTAMVTELVARLWPEAATREQPLRFYLNGMRALRVHRPEALLQSAQTSLGDHEIVRHGAIEQTLPPMLNQYTPGYAAQIAMLALTVCKNAHKTGEELEKCIDHYSAPSAAAVEP